MPHRNNQPVETEERYYVVIDRKRRYSFIQTDITFEEGINTFGHNLNSLSVNVSVVPNENTNINAYRDILFKELDQHSIIVQNNTGQSFIGTLIIGNREGAFRPLLS